MVLCLHATHWDVVALRRRARRSITDLFCTVIQLDLVGNSVVFIIAHGFLLSSVAQPGTRATHKVSLFVLIALLVILIGLQQLVYHRQFKGFAKHRHAKEEDSCDCSNEN